MSWTCPGKGCEHRHDGPDPREFTGPPCPSCYTCQLRAAHSGTGKAAR